VLNLASDTDPAWATSALEHLDDILLDHAHCEKKAAGAAVNLLFRYPQHAFLQQPLSRLAREELTHFEQVVSLIEKRGGTFGRQKPAAYGGRLHRHVRSGEPLQLLDILLVAALIEARSCERFKLLAEALEQRGDDLAAVYRGLLACEARHHQIYVDLACRLRPEAEVRDRLQELAGLEAEALREPSERIRVHS